MKKRWISVCRTQEVLPDSGVCALVEDKQIAIFRTAIDDSFYSLDNFDPIAQVNILSRGLIGEKEERQVVFSPLFKDAFCLSSGECISNQDYSVATYPIRVVDQIIEVAL